MCSGSTVDGLLKTVSLKQPLSTSDDHINGGKIGLHAAHIKIASVHSTLH